MPHRFDERVNFEATPEDAFGAILGGAGVDSEETAEDSEEEHIDG